MNSVSLHILQFETTKEDMEKEVWEYLPPLFAFSLASFHLQATRSRYGGEIKVESRQIDLSDMLSSLSNGSRSLRLTFWKFGVVCHSCTKGTVDQYLY